MATTERTIHRREVSDADLLRESDLFDEEFYLQQNPQLREQGKDAVTHYLKRGGFNGKDPSAAFSSRSYLQRNPEVAAAKINPLVHFLRIGRAEGRSMNPLADDIALIVESGLFDDDYYRHFHADLPEDADLVRHYLRFGARRGDDPSELFSTTGYQRQNVDVAKSGANPLLHYLRFGRHEGRIAPRGRLREPYFDSLFEQQWAQLAPLPVAHLASVGPRVTVLTDSVGPSSLFGGVGTSVILAILLANRFGATLRIATRTEAPDPSVVATLEQASGVRLEGALETAYVPVGGEHELAIAEDEILMTTSWWTTRATLGSTVPREQVLYLLQEDERMFYAFGDERLMCSETLGERGFTVVVNTQRLLDHLGSPDNYPHLAEEAIALTPAFPGGLPRDGADLGPRPEGKRRLFFYSRPENARNLFWRGGAVLSRAVEQGLIDPDVWELPPGRTPHAGPHLPARHQAAGRRGAQLARLPGARAHDRRRAGPDGHPAPVLPAARPRGGRCAGAHQHPRQQAGPRATTRPTSSPPRRRSRGCSRACSGCSRSPTTGPSARPTCGPTRSSATGPPAWPRPSTPSSSASPR